MTTDTCRHPVRELLDAHVNGSLPAEARPAVQAHLASCASCASETDALFEIAAAIERHGAAAGSRWRLPVVALAGLAAAAVLAVSLAVVSERGHQRDPATGGTGSIEPGETDLDLGSGPARGTEAPPIATLTPATRSLRLTLAPPVQPGARYSVQVWPREATTATFESALGDRDPMGRAAVLLPAAAVRTPGTYRLEVREVTADGVTHSYHYSFEVRLVDTPR